MAREDQYTSIERRRATVMFADIAGFTALSEKLDPEEVTAVMNDCFERLENIVFAHGGVVEEYLGDAVKAVFGLSPTTANPTKHAVAAALEIRDAVAHCNRERRLPAQLDIHIGINSGTVIGLVLGSGDAPHFSVAGETVRHAARLEHVANRGQIFVAAETYEETKNDFEYRPPPASADGAGGVPFPVFELLAPKRADRVVRQSERRQATVVFADVLGLASLSEHLDAAALGSVMRQCFADLEAAIVEHGGVLDKFTGDGVMALFGVPNAIENAPRQAINAAIDVRNRLSAFVAARQLPTRLGIHIGINTGLVIAGEIGGRVKRSFTTMGDTVNLAARLKDAAGENAVLVGPETHRYTRDDFEYRAMQPLHLKGKERPVPAYELVSLTEQVHRSTARTERMVFSAMVGRETELATFRTALECLVAGNGGILSLVGEAGLGKSRLLSEVLLIAEQMNLRVLLGRSLAVGRGQSFHPFVDLLRHWAGIGEDAGEAQALATLEAAVRATLGGETDEVFPFIARLLGLHVGGAHAERLAGIEGEALEKLILKSTRDLFRAIARQQPTALVFEDLHWADQSSLNLLESLLSLCGEAGLLFVHVFRPLFEGSSDRILRVCTERFAAHHREIRLDKLDETQAARLIGNLLNIDNLPDAVRTLIATKAEGNPFYIEEVVRSLIDQGAVEHHDGRFRVTDKLNSVVIPGTIQDVIMARVDRLDESARQLLQTASVVGRHFYHQIISHLIEREHPLDEDLAVLKEKQLIQESGTRWQVAVGERSVAQELEYIFKHALAQEAVYESLLLKTRKELHRRVAEAIESLFAERLPEFYAPLAYHYTRSEQLEPAERYLCKAGEEAIRAAAFREALQLFHEAATAYETLHGPSNGDPQHRAFIEKHLGLALLNTGQHAESVQHFDRALEWLGEPVPAHLLTQALRWAVDMSVVLFRIYIYEGRRGEVPNPDHEREVFKLYFERGKAEVYSDPRRLFFETAPPIRRYYRMDPGLIEHACSMYVTCATIFAYSGLSFTVSRRMLQVAASLLRDNHITDVFPYRAMLFTYEYLRGNWSEAPTLDDDLLEQALRHGMLWDVALYLCIEGDRRLRRGEFAGSRALIRKLAEISDTYGYAAAASNHDGNEAIHLLEERRLPEALARIEAHCAASHEATLKVMSLGMIAKAGILLGEREAAADALRRAAEVTKEAGVLSPWHQSIHHLAQLLFDVTALEAAAARGDRSHRRALRRAALGSARRAIRTASKVAKERAETYNLAGRLWWALGHPTRAYKWWRRSIAEGTRMGARPELARTYMDIGRRIGAAVLDDADGPAYLQRAARMFTELDLAWDLQQLDRFESEAGAVEQHSAVA